jgi:hypothetical protein
MTILEAKEEARKAAKRIRELERALEPFARVARINAPLAANWPDNKPNSDFIPNVWPNWGDFKRAASAIEEK